MTEVERQIQPKSHTLTMTDPRIQKKTGRNTGKDTNRKSHTYTDRQTVALSRQTYTISDIERYNALERQTHTPNFPKIEDFRNFE